jgi:hypothetical protein
MSRRHRAHVQGPAQAPGSDDDDATSRVQLRPCLWSSLGPASGEPQYPARRAAIIRGGVRTLWPASGLKGTSIVSTPSFDAGKPDHSDPGRSDASLHEDVGLRPGTLSSSRVSFEPYQVPPCFRAGARLQFPSSLMTRTSRVYELRRLQLNAENMARLSPFKADRERFARIAERYRREADALEHESEPGATCR